MKISNVDVTVVEVPQTEPLAPYRSHIRTSATTTKGIVRVDTDDGWMRPGPAPNRHKQLWSCVSEP